MVSPVADQCLVNVLSWDGGGWLCVCLCVCGGGVLATGKELSNSAELRRTFVETDVPGWTQTLTMCEVSHISMASSCWFNLTLCLLWPVLRDFALVSFW